MATPTYREATIEWALALIASCSTPAQRAPRKTAIAAPAQVKRRPTAMGKLPARPTAAAAIVARYGLEPTAVRLFELVYAVETSLPVARAARLLAVAGAGAATGGITVEVLGALLGEAARELLSPRGVLRARGLLGVSGVAGGIAEPSSLVRLSPGMRERWEGRELRADDLAVGVHVYAPFNEKPALPQGVLSALRDVSAETGPRLLSIRDPAAGLAPAIARTLASWRERPSILVDATVFALLPLETQHLLAAAIMREADLSDACLVVSSAWALSRAGAFGEPPRDGTQPLVVMVFGLPMTLEDAPAGYAVRRLDLTEASSAPTSVAAPAPVFDAIDRARQQAAIDAARAMGRPFPVMPHGMIPGSSFSPPPHAAQVASAPAAQSGPTAMPVAPRADVQPSTAARPDASRSPSLVTPPPRNEDAPSGKPATSPYDVVGPSRPARERGKTRPAAESAPSKSTDERVAAQPPPPQENARVPGSVVAAGPEAGTGAHGDSVVVGAVGDVGGSADPSESLPWLDVPRGSAIGELMQITTRAANPLQRAELLGRMSGESRDPQLVALVRGHLKADHPSVRAAAEQAMARLFGPGWDRARSIPKPVQPPHSDDGGSGPPWR